MKTLFKLALFVCLCSVVWGQCGKMVRNPMTGKMDCTGPAGSIPSMTSQSGKVLSNDGTNASWLNLIGFTSNGTDLVPDPTVLPELGGNNVWTGHQSYPASANQPLTAVGSTFVCNQRTINVSASSTLTLTAGPADGYDGQVCVILNTGTYDFTFPVNGTTNVTVGAKKQVRIEFHSALGTTGEWVQEGGSGQTIDVSKMVASKFCKASGWSTTSTTSNNPVSTVTLTGVAPYGLLRITEEISKSGSTQSFSTRWKVGTAYTSSQQSHSTDFAYNNMLRTHSMMLLSSSSQSVIGIGQSLKAGTAGTASTMSAMTNADISGGSLTIEFDLWLGGTGTDTVTHDYYCIEYVPPAN